MRPKPNLVGRHPHDHASFCSLDTHRHNCDAIARPAANADGSDLVRVLVDQKILCALIPRLAFGWRLSV
jgi:hypothetical protein